nr:MULTISPECIES: YfhO family protein [Myxococcaceae]
MAGLAYVPWFLVVLSGTARPARRVAGLAALGALQALSGDPQSVLYAALAALAWVATRPAPRERKEGLLVAGAGLALAALLAAPQLLPAWNTLRLSTRSAPGADFAQWTLHPVRLLELFLPFALGGHLETPAFWARFAVEGPAPLPFSLSLYLGAATLPLGLLGLRRGSPWARFGLVLLLGGLLLALGSHVGLGALHTRLPPFRFFRYPEKYAVLATLGWAVLVGLGFARALEPAPLPRRRLGLLALGLGLAGALLALLALWPGGAREAGAWALRASGSSKALSADAPAAALRPALAQALGFGALALGALALLRRRPGAWPARALLGAVLALDLLLAARRIVWFGDPALFRAPSPVAEAVRAHAPAGPFRLWRDTLGLRGAVPELHTRGALEQARAWERATLKSNLASLFGLEELSGYGAVQLAREAALVQALKGQELRLAQLLNACFLLTAPHAPVLAKNPRVQQVAAWPELKASLWLLRDCPARLRSPARVQLAHSEDEAARLLAAPGFDPLTEAVVEVAGGAPPRQGPLAPATLSDAAHGTGFAAVRAQVPADGSLLVFATASHPGWRAWVDGRPAPLVHVDLAAMGVWLEPGEHRVELRYREPGLGLAFGLGALGLLLTLALTAWRRPRRPPPEPPGTAASAPRW